jgi:hypothetical protein
LTAIESAKAYPEALRRISYRDPITEKRLRFLTNNFVLPALTIAEIYRCRWQVELFFKWIKQHLRIKAFYGTSENAVKTQIWGSAQEPDGDGILGCFLEYHEFRSGCSHPLGFQQ